jgi:hypothetical protein
MGNLGVGFSVVAIASLFLLCGCYSPRELTRNDLDAPGDAIHLRTVKLINGSELDFRSDSLGYAVIQDSKIVGRLKSGELRRVPVDSLKTPGRAIPHHQNVRQSI